MLDEKNTSAVNKTPPSRIEDEMRDWPASPYLKAAVAESTGSPKPDPLLQKSVSRRRAFSWPLLIATLTAAALVIWWFGLRNSNRVITQSNSSPTPVMTPTPAPPPSFDPQTAQVKAGEPNNRDGYRVTEATISSAGQDLIKLVKYEFYSSWFIVNNTTLKNEGDMVNVFKSQQEEISGTWVLIFASASLEGDEGYNTDLCRRRIYRVKELMSQDAGIKAKEYWGILAGEYKMPLPGVAPGYEEEAEEREAKKRREGWLSPQRKLIVITIHELKPIPKDKYQEVPLYVARSISAQDMLPRTYDAPDSPPFLLKDGDARR
jgi:hypothetical protein